MISIKNTEEFIRHFEIYFETGIAEVLLLFLKVFVVSSSGKSVEKIR